jgi:acetyl esterase/lipase
LRKYAWIVLAGVFAGTASGQTTPPWQPTPGHETLKLWPTGAPNNPPSPGPEKDAATPQDQPVGGKPVLRITNVSDPTITVYAPPKGKETGAAALVFPGGSYQVLAIDKEGTEICDWLNSLGITAILLKYRVPDSGPYPKSSAAFEDGQRAVGLVRAHAEQWHIDPHRIGVIGFSAGAHLAAMLSNQYDKRIYRPIDAADQVSSRPDFALIIYPGWLRDGEQNFDVNPAIKFNPNAPPAFLVQAENDFAHVENSIAYFLALKKAKIPAEMHIYAEGGHGYGMRATGKPIASWPQTATVWFHTIGVLK